MLLKRRGWLAVTWVVAMVGLFTAWDRFGLHLAFSPARLVLRVVMFGAAAAVLGVLLGRMQGRQR